MWDTWFIATMHPPVAGIFSPSIHRRLVRARKVGLRMTTTVDHAQPRFCCSGRTFDIPASLPRDLTRNGAYCPPRARPGRCWQDRTDVAELRGAGPGQDAAPRQVAAGPPLPRRTRGPDEGLRPRR